MEDEKNGQTDCQIDQELINLKNRRNAYKKYTKIGFVLAALILCIDPIYISVYFKLIGIFASGVFAIETMIRGFQYDNIINAKGEGIKNNDTAEIIPERESSTEKTPQLEIGLPKEHSDDFWERKAEEFAIADKRLDESIQRMQEIIDETSETNNRGNILSRRIRNPRHK